MRNFFYRLSSAFRRFMTGRYGSDQLNMALLVVAIVCDILNVVFARRILFLGGLFSLISTAAIVFAIVRMLSRNISRRYEENQKFLKFWNQLKMLRHFHIYRCKNCHQKIRVPRKGGKRVEIRCPKCGQTFIRRI